MLNNTEQPTQIHIDTNGKWGGNKATIAHFDDRLMVYMLVGEYNDIGCWPGDVGCSRWTAVKTFLEILDSGDIDLFAIQNVMREYARHIDHREKNGIWFDMSCIGKKSLQE